MAMIAAATSADLAPLGDASPSKPQAARTNSDYFTVDYLGLVQKPGFGLYKVSLRPKVAARSPAIGRQATSAKRLMRIAQVGSRT
jgi:hypothetical protein